MNLQTQLLEWFHKNARPLPWRKKYAPYEVWISEIMLQQTQVETALPYFDRWMKVFPTLGSLARSDEKKVLKLWQGLGYYSRARNLHASAKLVMKKFNGVFPEDYETILSLKGIGRYSAGAIASIAFNQKRPIVDGNVLRVLSRVYAIEKPIDVEKNKVIFWELQERLIPEGQARFFNQALMELGALVCFARNPACAVCPIRNFCAAFKNGTAENYPIRHKKKKTVKISASALVLKRNDKYFIRKRPLGQIMGGLWEFPEWKLAQNKTLAVDESLKKTVRLAEKEFSIKLGPFEPMGVIKRNYTTFNESLNVFLAEISSQGLMPKERGGWPAVWASRKELKSYPFSSAHLKIAQLIELRSTARPPINQKDIWHRP